MFLQAAQTRRTIGLSIAWIGLLLALGAVLGMVGAQEPGSGETDSASAADFHLAVLPAEQRLAVGYSTSCAISVTAQAGFSSAVTLTVSALPQEFSSTLTPGQITPTATSLLSITAGPAAPTGTYGLVVTGTSGSLVHTAPLTLRVEPPSQVFVPLIARWYDTRCPRFEPNDTRAQAYGPILPRVQYVSYICPGTDSSDYFSLTARSRMAIIVDLTNLNSLPAGVDYDLYLYDSPTSQTPVAMSNHYGQVDEQIAFGPTQAGVYYLRVYPFQGWSYNVPYNLTFGDDYEPNNSRTEAWGPLKSGQTYLAYLWGAADGTDYYRIEVPAIAPMVLDLTNLNQMPAGVDYDLYLYDSPTSEFPVAWSNQYGQVNEHIEYSPKTTGTYYVRVYPYSGYSGETPYYLRVLVGP
jgi:hypothetical protein